MARAQPKAQAARIEASAAPQAGALTQPQIAALRQAMQSLQHINALVLGLRHALHSHELDTLDAQIELMRHHCASGVEAIYRKAANAPAPKFDHVREDALALYREAEAVLFPKVKP